jgi:hypothetical protein
VTHLIRPRSMAMLALAAGLAVPATFPAAAAYPYDHYGHWHGYYHNNTGAIVGGALLGLGLGAVIGSTLAAPPPAYYAPPPPVYYAPAPPTYYAPPPPAYYGY